MPRHDADLDLLGRGHAWAVRPEQQRPALFIPHAVAHAHHVAHRDALGDADREVEVGLHRFPDRVRRERRRDVDHGDIAAGLFFCLGDVFVDGNAFEAFTRFFGIDPCHVASLPVRIGAARLRVELAGLAGDALRHHLRVLVDEDAHFFPFTAATARSPASAMLFAAMIGRPESARIFLPRSSLVPFMRTTSGTESLTSRAADTTPAAIVSHFMMPPKMLTRMPFTFGFESMILNAAVTFSAVAPPPTSRKFAGSPP